MEYFTISNLFEASSHVSIESKARRRKEHHRVRVARERAFALLSARHLFGRSERTRRQLSHRHHRTHTTTSIGRRRRRRRCDDEREHHIFDSGRREPTQVSRGLDGPRLRRHQILRLRLGRDRLRLQSDRDGGRLGRSQQLHQSGGQLERHVAACAQALRVRVCRE